MGFKFIGRQNFLSYTPTASPAANTDFPVTNLYNYNALRVPYHSIDTTQSHSIVFDKGSTYTSVCLFIDDVNFTGATVYHGNSTPPTSNPFSLTFTLDERTQRYKYYYDFTTTNRYIRLVIPAQPTTDGTDYFRIGRVIIGGAAIELTRNIFYPYTITAPKKYAVVEFESGSEEAVNLGSYKIFQCEFGVSAMTASNASQWWSLDAVDEDMLILMYENAGDTSKAYVVQRKGSIAMQEISNNIYAFGTYVLKEKI